MIAAPVQCNVDAVPNGSHYLLLNSQKTRRITLDARDAPTQRFVLASFLMIGCLQSKVEEFVFAARKAHFDSLFAQFLMPRDSCKSTRS